jgi:DNA topoisomerase VI subunit B
MNLSNNFADFFFLKFVESPAEFFAENKNIAGFDNVRIVI